MGELFSHTPGELSSGGKKAPKKGERKKDGREGGLTPGDLSSLKEEKSR